MRYEERGQGYRDVEKVGKHSISFQPAQRPGRGAYHLSSSDAFIAY